MTDKFVTITEALDNWNKAIKAEKEAQFAYERAYSKLSLEEGHEWITVHNGQKPLFTSLFDPKLIVWDVERFQRNWTTDTVLHGIFHSLLTLFCEELGKSYALLTALDVHRIWVHCLDMLRHHRGPFDLAALNAMPDDDTMDKWIDRFVIPAFINEILNSELRHIREREAAWAKDSHE